MRARFNTVYQLLKCAEYDREAPISGEHLAQYAAQFPAEGDKIERMRKVSTFKAAGTAAGFVGSTVQMMRWTRTVPLVVTGVFVSTVAAHVVADDVRCCCCCKCFCFCVAYGGTD